MLGSRWVSTTIDISSKLNWAKPTKIGYFYLFWTDSTFLWPWYDLGVILLWSPTPTHVTICTWVGFIKCIWSTGYYSHWSKHDTRCVIWSIPAIRERVDIRVIWCGITPPALILPPRNPSGCCDIAPFWGLGEFQPPLTSPVNRIWAKLYKKLFSLILSWFDPAFVEFGCHGYQINTDKWPIKANNHTWACNISIIALFIPN